LDSSNTWPAAGTSRNPALAANGSSVAFVSDSGELVPGVPGGRYEIFWRNLVEQHTILVSANTNGGPAAASHELVLPAINEAGSTVAFESSATDLVADDLNQAVDVFANRSLSNALPECVSVAYESRAAATGPGGMTFGRNSVSANGQVAVFFGDDSALASNDTNHATDIFEHDFATGTNRMINPGTNSLVNPEISVDGRYITYTRLLPQQVQRYR